MIYRKGARAEYRARRVTARRGVHVKTRARLGDDDDDGDNEVKIFSVSVRYRTKMV